ncbi:hypothetical protein MTR67_051835 [Solanum verrucosum]|uniref:Uncharacterized protein n=1 Tax=Solanum verrucosum TaxID=315347 RepID=A0AAF0V4Q1_SOLVR|nr:hypothetical protein MTR67_051835 [Solanum verrucosum]
MGLGTPLKLSTAFHPRTIEQVERFGITPFEALYGRRCRYPIGLFKVGEMALIGPKFGNEATEKGQLIRERL